jgi:hypothetical protein
MRMSYWLYVLCTSALVSCGGGPERDQAATNDTGGMMGHMDSVAMGGMGMGGTQMMTQMRAHMDSMSRMSPQQMQAMIASHEAMMSQMMDRMGAEMRGMNMSGPPEWTALTDSVKQDLAELPALKGQALTDRMRAHTQRVRRLMAAHQQMMKGT